MDPLTFERISFLILPISKALIALWFLEIGHIGCMLFSKVTSREIRFMIGLVFTIGNIFLSQQNNGIDLNNMSLGIQPPLFFVTGIIGSFGALFVFEFLEDYIPFTILNYFGKNSLTLMCITKTVLYYFYCNCRMEDHIRNARDHGMEILY